MPKKVCALCLLLLPTNQLAAGEIEFVPLHGYQTHVGVKPQIGHHLLRIDARFRDLSGKSVFARVRCVADDGQEFVTQTSVKLQSTDETWSFYFRAARFDDVEATYVLELGEKQPGQPLGEAVRTWHMFSLQPVGGSYNFGSGDAVPPIAKLIASEDGHLAVVYQPADKEATLTRRLVRQFNGVTINGRRAAVRIARSRD